MKVFTALSLFIFLFSACRAKTINELALQAAGDLLEAGKRSDWEKIIEYTCPLQVKEFGGKEEMIKVLKKESKKIKSRAETELNKVEEVIRVNGTTYVRISYDVFGVLPVNKFRVNIIGVSKDKGKTWWFIDGPLHSEKLKKYLPELVGKMAVPTMQRFILPSTKQAN